MRGKSNVIKRNVETVWGARYTLGARYLPKNTVFINCIPDEGHIGARNMLRQ
jgi:hypothetical protein